VEVVAQVGDSADIPVASVPLTVTPGMRAVARPQIMAKGSVQVAAPSLPAVQRRSPAQRLSTPIGSQAAPAPTTLRRRARTVNSPALGIPRGAWKPSTST
jgi:hypothetical protein